MQPYEQFHVPLIHPLSPLGKSVTDHPYQFDPCNGYNQSLSLSLSPTHSLTHALTHFTFMEDLILNATFNMRETEQYTE
jgi:hypothetical protein